MKKIESNPPVAGQAVNIWKLGTYDGAELKPYTGRAGAMDAYRLPSLGRGISMHEYVRRTRTVEPPAGVIASKKELTE